MTDRKTRRGGGRAARQAARAAVIEREPFLTRSLAPIEVLGDEGLSIIEENAETILERVGMEVIGYEEGLRIFAEGGAEVDGTRVRFPRGMCREIIQKSAPRSFVQHARNSQRSVTIGDPHIVLAPAYGSPFVRDLDNGRRYATYGDFVNFVKLAYTSPVLHHNGGTLVEPVDLPVNKRHYEMVYAHIRYSDRAFMGSVTNPSRAEDTVEMCRVFFGDDYLDDHTVVLGLCNANSPMGWDYNMLGSAKAYAEANQAVLITPFILAGAMSPVTVAGAAAQTLAEAMAGLAFTQIVRPGAPVIMGSFASSMSMQSGAPTFGTPEPMLLLITLAQLARRLGVPFRSAGNFTASKIPDAQAAYESMASFLPGIQVGVNFLLHTAGWLEGGLTMGYEKFILDEDQAGAAAAYVKGVDLSENGQALATILETGPGQHFLGTAHTLANFETAFWKSALADNNSFEQWSDEGGLDAVARANQAWKRRLAEYVEPSIDEKRHAALREWIDQRKSAVPDSDV